MSFAATWMDLETIILNEVNEKEKVKYYIYHLYVGSKICHKHNYETHYLYLQPMYMHNFDKNKNSKN